MMPTPTQADLEARNAAAAAGRRIEAAREQGGDAAADAERDAIRAELGLQPMKRTETVSATTADGTASVTHTVTVQQGDGLTARVTSHEAAVMPTTTADDDEGVEFVGMTMGGEPLPDAVTEADTPAPVDGRQPYEAPVLTHLGTLDVTADGNVNLGTIRVNGALTTGATVHQPTKMTGEDHGFAVVEKDGPAQLTFTPDFVQDGMATALFAMNRLGAFRAGERASEDGPIKPHEVRVLWFCGAFRPYSADWSGSEAFNRAQQFADALRKAGLTDVAVTNHPGVQIEPETGGEGVQAAEEAPEGMQTPQALAGACGAISVGDRYSLETADTDSSIYVDWRGSTPGAVHMRAFFDEVQNALGFCRALMKRGDVKEAVARIPVSDGEQRRAAAQAFAAEGMGQQVVDQLREATRDAALSRVVHDQLKAAFRRHQRLQAIKLGAIQTVRTFVNGILLGFGILAAFAIAGVVMGLAR